MSFYTAINCMDGRVQLPVIYYLKERFGVPYVDVITEPGPVALLSSDPESFSPRYLPQYEQIVVMIVSISYSQHCYDSGISKIYSHDACYNLD